MVHCSIATDTGQCGARYAAARGTERGAAARPIHHTCRARRSIRRCPPPRAGVWRCGGSGIADHRTAGGRESGEDHARGRRTLPRRTLPRRDDRFRWITCPRPPRSASFRHLRPHPRPSCARLVFVLPAMSARPARPARLACLFAVLGTINALRIHRIFSIALAMASAPGNGHARVSPLWATSEAT